MNQQLKIVAIGGGTGLSSLLKGLKNYTEYITAIVTVGDDGGSSGQLRKDYNMPPPGDIRNCIVALADDELMMAELMQYRFASGSLKGHSLGNVIIAAMTDVEGSFVAAIEKLSDFLAIKGKVLPVTENLVKLKATLNDGTTIVGESAIPFFQLQNGNEIKKVELIPNNVIAYKEAVDAVYEADAVVIGPGSLYTSLIPNLLVEGMVEAIANTKAKKIYVANIMTQPGETTGYNLSMHINALEQYLGKDVLDIIIEDNSKVPTDILKRYWAEGAAVVEAIDHMEGKYELIFTEIADFSGKLGRHNPNQLSKKIIDVIENNR
jgi:uncharacterized cofD-like protein